MIALKYVVIQENAFLQLGIYKRGIGDGKTVNTQITDLPGITYPPVSFKVFTGFQQIHITCTGKL